MNWKDLKKMADEKAEYLESIPDIFMNEVYKAQTKLYKQLIDFTDGFDTEDGQFENSTDNIKRINKLDDLFNDYQRTVVYSLIASLILSLKDTVSKNNEYYTSMLQFSNDIAKADSPISLATFDNKLAVGITELKPVLATMKKAGSVINARLGLTAEGALIPNGYLYNIYTNTATLNYCREAIYKGIVTKMPVADFKKALKEDVTGLVQKTPDEGTRVIQNGILAKEYTIIANDVFAKVDRTAGIIVQQDFDLKYFIYGGTIIKTSRPFCINKCNKVFSTKDAQGWENEVPGPIIKGIDDYNPLVDLGGWGCRHSLLYISSELYEVLKEEKSDLIPE